jgi:hypothetical protein
MKSQVLFDGPVALKHAQKAITLATELNNPELLAAAHVHAACTYYQQQNVQSAQIEIAQARQYLENISNSALKGNIYLESANINTLMGPLDPQLQMQCQKWQDQAAKMLYNGKIEPDGRLYALQSGSRQA